jgi:hypothetical protein
VVKTPTTNTSSLLRAVSFACAVTLTAGAAVVASPTPAAASSPSVCASHPGYLWTLHCASPRSGAYSPDRWQWTSASVAVDGRGSGLTADVSYVIDDMQYYWGLKWYRNKYRADTTATITIEGANGTVHDKKTFKVTSNGSAVMLGGKMNIPGGTFRVVVESHVRGMWWGYPNGRHKGYPGETDVSEKRTVIVHNPLRDP